MLHAAFLRNQLISLLILDNFQKFSCNDGQSKPMNLDIELVNCDITAFKNGNAKTGSVKLALQAQQLVVILVS